MTRKRKIYRLCWHRQLCTGACPLPAISAKWSPAQGCLQSTSSFTLVGCGNVVHALSLVNTQFSVMASLMLSCLNPTDAANTPKVTCRASSADRLCMDRTTYCHHSCLGTALLTPVHFSTQIKLFNLTLNEPQNIPGLACNLEERHFTIKCGSEKLGRFVLLVFAGGKMSAPCIDRQMCSA